MGDLNNADLKEVKFNEYCQKCKDFETKDWENPCSECICLAFRAGTEVPLHYIEGKNKAKNEKK